MRVLVATVGRQDPVSAKGPLPAARLALGGAYGTIYLLATNAGIGDLKSGTLARAEKTRAYVSERSTGITIRIQSIDTDAPNDLSSVLGPVGRALEQIAADLAPEDDVTVCATAGTPAIRQACMAHVAASIPFPATWIEVAEPAEEGAPVEPRETPLGVLRWNAELNATTAALSVGDFGLAFFHAGQIAEYARAGVGDRGRAVLLRDGCEVLRALDALELTKAEKLKLALARAARTRAPQLTPLLETLPAVATERHAIWAEAVRRRAARRESGMAVILACSLVETILQERLAARGINTTKLAESADTVAAFRISRALGLSADPRPRDIEGMKQLTLAIAALGDERLDGLEAACRATLGSGADAQITRLSSGFRNPFAHLGAEVKPEGATLATTLADLAVRHLADAPTESQHAAAVSELARQIIRGLHTSL